ncbi:zinc metalloproteinase nas-4-like [Limulus polyphemus]|uniref:Metalloendopeptidase n=1 Tax=Limulus polyphemus TaxID=6850 RepID=A0ABM1SBA9_LIMPO|nr:zinc metalloproteinase nas-4-like [Limulus polyphemus]
MRILLLVLAMVLDVVLCSKFDIYRQGQKVTPYGRLVEGDIMLLNERSVGERAALRDRRYQWQNKAVPYVLSNSYSSSEVAVIKSAMEEYSKLTCIRFIQRTTQRDYLYISSMDGCWSYMGRIGGRQDVSLASRGCIYKGIVMHELMHALGFEHEHSRPDREQFLNILWANIDRNNWDQFQVASSFEFDTLSEAYDYRSVMHYDGWAFAKGKEPSMMPKQTGVDIYELGRGLEEDRFTKLDLTKLDKYYCR